MRAARAFLAAALSAFITGCSAVDLDSLIFTCTSDRDCARGKRCHPTENICVHPEDLPARDGGFPDADPPDTGDDPPDGGPNDASPDAGGMSCVASGVSAEGRAESWWCYRATTAELDQFARDHRGQVADIEIEPGNDERRYAAVILAGDGLSRRWVYQMRRETLPDGTVRHPDLELGHRIDDVEPYRRTGPQPEYALSMISNAYGCGWYWFFTSPDPGAIYSTLAGRDIEQPVIDMDRFRDGNNNRRAVFVTHGRGSSTVAFDLSAVQIDSWLEGQDHTLASFQSTGDPDQFNVVIGDRDTGDPDRFWVHTVEARELELMSIASPAHVVDIDIYDTAGGRTFAALFADTSSATRARVRESERLAALVNTATAGIYLKEIGEQTAVALVNERRRFSPGDSLAPLIAAGALLATTSSPAEAALSELVPIPATECGTSASATISEPLSEVLAKMLRDRDRRRAAAAVERFSLSGFNGLAANLGMAATIVDVAPGCEAPGTTNETTLLDLALLFEYSLQCSIRGANGTLYRSWLRAADPERLHDAAGAIAEELGAAANLSREGIEEYRSRFDFLYSSSPGSFAGRVSIPICGSRGPTSSTWFFAVFVEGAASPEELKKELFRVPLSRAFAGDVSCFEP